MGGLGCEYLQESYLEQGITKAVRHTIGIESSNRWINEMDKTINFLMQARQEMQTKWNRVLPMNELLSDRWEKAKFLGFGTGSSAYDSCVILGSVAVGENVWIGPYTYLDGRGGLTIGDGCQVGVGMTIFSIDTRKFVLSNREKYPEEGAVNIGRSCYLGVRSVICPGITLGDYCVVTAQSIVTQSFPSGSVVSGNPAKKIGDIRLLGMSCKKEVAGGTTHQ